MRGRRAGLKAEKLLAKEVKAQAGRRRSKFEFYSCVLYLKLDFRGSTTGQAVCQNRERAENTSVLRPSEIVRRRRVLVVELRNYFLVD